MNVRPIPAGPPRMVTTHSDDPSFLLEVTGAFDHRTQTGSGTASITQALIIHSCFPDFGAIHL